MRNKRWKITVFIFLGLLLLIAGMWYFLNWRADNLLRKSIHTYTADDVHFDYEDLSLNIFTGHLSILNLRLYRGNSSKPSWEFVAGRFEIASFTYALKDGLSNIGLEKIALFHPQLSVYVSNPDFFVLADTTSSTDEGKGVLNKLSIDTIQLVNGDLLYDPIGPEHAKSHFDVHVYGFGYKPKNKKISWNASTVSLDSLEYQFADSVYNLKVSSINIFDEDKRLEVNGLSMKSNFSKAAFQRYYGHRKSRVDVDLPQLVLSAYNFSMKDTFLVETATITDAKVVLSRDNRLPFPDRVTQLPQAMLSELAVKIRIDTLLIENGELLVELTGKSTKSAVPLDFKKMKGTVLGLQNIDLDLPAFSAKADARFLDEATLELTLLYDYGPGNPWQMTAVATTLDMTKLNPILSSEVGIDLETGNLLALYFTMYGDNYTGKGEMIFQYENLHVILAEKEDEERSKIFSFLAETVGSIFYNKKNPDSKDSKKAVFELDRNVQKDFTGQWLDALMQGMIITISKLDPRKVQAAKDKRDSKSASTAQAKIDRKEARQERRDARRD